MKKIRISYFNLFFTIALFLTLASLNVSAQLSGNERDMALGMLQVTKDNIKDNYYDTNFRGINIDELFNQSKEKLKNASSRDEAMTIIAQTMLTFDDSHTNFFPPSRSADIDYGWLISMVGKDCFVTGVKPKSDAEAKGLKVGDKVLAIDGFRPTGENLWKMYYRYYSIMPAARVRLVVQSPNDAEPRAIDINTKITKTSKIVTFEDIFNRIIRKGWDLSADRYFESGKDLYVWKLSTFSTSEAHIDTVMAKAKNYPSLIIDLRNNGGGSVDALRRLTGYFFDKDVTLCDEKTRKTTKPIIAKTRGGGIYKGKLIVLVDSNSASASEVFARTIQLQGRGKVIGDKTAGAVMESRFYISKSGVGSVAYFGVSVTIADLIMPDGKSLEKAGVIPDEVLLPGGQEMAERKDLVLSSAAKHFGIDISPEKAGTIFPLEWNN
jgi:carboxyl-terminal processing protease